MRLRIEHMLYHLRKANQRIELKNNLLPKIHHVEAEIRHVSDNLKHKAYEERLNKIKEKLHISTH